MRTPELHFRLPGTWHSIDLRGGRTTENSIEKVVRAAIGVADNRAHQRAQLRGDLQRAAEAGQEAEATAMLVCAEIAHRLPLPVTLVVHAPHRLRMSPSVGTAPEKVLAVFTEGLQRHSPELAASIAQVRAGGIPVVRTHRVEPIEVAVADEAGAAQRLVADYWVPVPESKQVVMARLSTPMGEIEHVMLSLFDALVEASYFRRSQLGKLMAGA